MSASDLGFLSSFSRKFKITEIFIQQLVQYGTTTLNIEVVLGRQSPSFSLKLLRRMISIAKKADERMRQVIF